MIFKKICPICSTEFEAEVAKAKFCSQNCYKICLSKKKFPEDHPEKYVECKICRLRGRQLIQHITKIHRITLDEYCKKYNLTYTDLQTKELHDQMSNNIKKACSEGRCGFAKGGYNPSKSEDCHNGRNSVWSMNFHGYDGLTDDEKKLRIVELGKTAQKSRDDNHNNATKIDYYTSRGYSEDEARRALVERQSTFTLEKCIKKYGEEEGTKRFNARQEKWQATLNSKPPEEIARINKARAAHSRNVVAYSKISQELFNAIFDIIKNDYEKIYYATLPSNDLNFYKNYEYEVLLEDHIHRYFLDFYVKDNNKVIEFDGDYWHGEKRGNQKRDAEREACLRKLGFTNILHVRECDYKNNPTEVIAVCVEFIRG